MGDLFRFNLEGILSRESIYGLIWKGTYRSDKAIMACKETGEGKGKASEIESVDSILEKCVLKMVALTSGVHSYSKHGKSLKGDLSAFSRDEEAPFLHTLFKERKAMEPKDFVREAKNLEDLSYLGLAPKVFKVWIQERHGLEYGFIGMARTDCSLKDVLLKKDLSDSEMKLVKKAIEKLHSHGITHGDCKPSNIGVYLDALGRVESCVFFDCQKVRHVKDLSSREAEKYRERDFKAFKKHVKKNTEIDRKEGKRDKKDREKS